MEGNKRPSVFARKAILGLAITQILLGVACVLCAVFAIEYYRARTLMLKATSAFHGWLEVVFIAAGITGVLSFVTQRVGVIISHMVLSIISTVCAVPIVVLSVYFFIGYYDGHIILAILAFLEFAVAMASSILCCRAVCCCGMIGETSFTYEVTGPAAETQEMIEQQPSANDGEKVEKSAV